MSKTLAGDSDQLCRRFSRFMRRVRRRAWTIVFMRYWLRAATICFVIAAALHVHAGLGLSIVIEGAAAVSLIVTMVFSILRRELVEEYTALVDRHYDAAGRIVAATEFLRSGKSSDAFRKLAIEDAAAWIGNHRRRGLPWTLGRARRPAAELALCVAVGLLFGCESPQPAARPGPVSEPDVAPPGLAERPEERKTTVPTTEREEPEPEEGDEGEAVVEIPEGSRPGEMGTGPGDTGRSDGTEGTAPQPVVEPVPEPAPEPADEQPGAAEPEDEPEPPDEASEPEIRPPGASQAGTQEAEKKQDDREVTAPEDDIRAPNADDDAPGVGPETEGIGEEFIDGATPPPQTQPVTPEDYRDARRQDLTRERVSPARRELIDRYFENLRKSGGRPASQPASRPAREARQP